ncbi:MAG: HAMP domain-containing sensor histidine kinase [Sulfurimonas sp.]|nr:HAMP domain-containing sensor histidine kinase [Sulfurimonas sp.]
MVVNVPIYVFGSIYFQEILKKSEQEKITLMMTTLAPAIAFNISFDQENQLSEILNGILKYEDIQKIELDSLAHKKNLSKQTDPTLELFQYEHSIIDPFEKIEIAKITLYYSNTNLKNITQQIFITIFFIFIFALIVFAIIFYSIRTDLNALKTIANAMKEYSVTKKMQPILLECKSEEINTIANVTNQMIDSISHYLMQLKSFNNELQEQIEDEILKQQQQERLMIHQSRQAAMGEMLESIAHQWRQPLNIIGLATANIETEYKLGVLNEKKFDEKMEIVSLNLQHMSNTIDDFRNFLNPERKLERFHPYKSIGEILNILDAQFSNSNIRFKLIEESNVTFYGVENELKQVMFILLSNAKDAIMLQIQKQKISQGLITITIKEQSAEGIIEVCDNGGGVEESIVNTIFDPYVTTKSNANGTGIGLYIAKNIIESRMKGSLRVQNTQEGSCFIIRISLENLDKKENEVL